MTGAHVIMEPARDALEQACRDRTWWSVASSSREEIDSQDGLSIGTISHAFHMLVSRTSAPGI
jgi:hypothetical protein